MTSDDRKEELPFTVRRARPDDYEALCALRSQAYARHDYLPGVSERLLEIDEADLRAILLVAQSKATGEIVGTIRLNSSLRGTTPVPVEMLQAPFSRETFVYTDRFAAASGPLADIVALALIKAQWYAAYVEGVAWIVGAGLRPLARRYRMVGLRTLTEVGEKGRFAIPHLHTSPYEAVGERLAQMPVNLRKTSRFFVPFFLERDHPDILIEKSALLREHVERSAHAETTAQELA